MTDVAEGLAPVTQSDRERAADYFADLYGYPAGSLTVVAMREGRHWTDDGKLVQALARHRRAALADQRKGTHPDDLAVDRFAARMKAKLTRAREKGRGGWDDPKQCSPDVLRTMLREHIAKGDPVDVANFAMMLDHHDAPTSDAAPATRAVPECGMTSEEGKALRAIGKTLNEAAERVQAMLRLVPGAIARFAIEAEGVTFDVVVSVRDDD